ncbi:hypothetical protein ABID39_000980 [Bartonella japonica]|uniref:Uncharacterized protein n=1 Tax=Bartonella japonica TaxID=357761 RepID=A0ABV2FNY9_9HYPH
MFINSILRIFITVIFCFSQTIQVHANLWRKKSQEEIFTVVVAQNKEIPVQVINKAFVDVSGKISEEKRGVFTGSNIEKVVFIAIGILLGKLASKTVGILKRWAGDAIYRAIINCRDAYYKV